MNRPHSLLLVDIRSAENVGAIFRTADAVGIGHIYLGGYTPGPLDRFGRKRRDVGKAALGAEDSVPYTEHADVLALLARLKQEGNTIVAIEQSSRAVRYTEVPKTLPTTFVVGNEVTGLSEEVLSYADYIAEIPMSGAKESLNVSVATGVALFRILDP